MKYSIEIQNNEMSYGFNQKSLWDLNINFEKGKKYAIVGTPNSGKHSMVNMLLKLYERIDDEETQSRIKKEKMLFENTKLYFKDYFDEVEEANPDLYPVKGTHPDRLNPNDRGDAFQIWATFVTRLPDVGGDDDDEEKEDSPEDSFLRVLGVDLSNCSPFELRRHCGYLSSKAMIYNGTLYENIDFAREYKDNPWRIVKILSFLGFFPAWRESMNMDDAFERFQETLFKPAIDMNPDELAKKEKLALKELHKAPVKTIIKPPINETQEKRRLRVMNEELAKNRIEEAKAELVMSQIQKKS